MTCGDTPIIPRRCHFCHMYVILVWDSPDRKSVVQWCPMCHGTLPSEIKNV